MNEDENNALKVIEGGMELLQLAINNGDPKQELQFRVRDLLGDVHALRAGKAKAVAGFSYNYGP